MKYLKISNPGEIELNAFRLIGASTKREDDSKIGFFGSGLKYSMAFLLSNNIKFEIFSGDKAIGITTKPVTYRNQEFNVIYINGEETSMTTEMGPGWKTWFAIREIFCNAIDEGGQDIEIVSTASPKAGETAFFIEINKEIGEILNEWTMYFSGKRPGAIYDNRGTKIFKPTEDDDRLIVYRKGIQCYSEKSCNPIFHYDLPWITINESRVIESTYSFNKELVHKFFFNELNSPKVLKLLLDNMCADKYTFERNLPWHYFSTITNLNLWLEAINERIVVIHEICGWYSTEISANPKKHLILPSRLVEVLQTNLGDRLKVLGDSDGSCFFKKAETDQKHEFIMKEVMKFFQECKYPVDYPIEIVSFSNPRRLGTIKDNNIYISEKLFQMGKREIVKTVIEENEHLKTGFSDETRPFQDHFINKYLSTLEEKHAYFL